MARPIKKEHRIGQPISCYQKDLDFFNDHKGNMSLSAYLIEAGYHYAGDTTRDEKRIEKLKEAKRRIAELEKKVSLQDAIIKRLQKKAPVTTISPEELENHRTKLFEDNKNSLAILWRKHDVPWERVVEIYKFTNKKEAEEWLRIKFEQIEGIMVG